MKLFKIIPVLIIALLLGACQSVSTQPVAEKLCREPRPEICTMNYLLVCGVREDKTVKTYSNGCTACSDPDVVGYNEGEC